MLTASQGLTSFERKREAYHRRFIATNRHATQMWHHPERVVRVRNFPITIKRGLRTRRGNAQSAWNRPPAAMLAHTRERPERWRPPP